MSRPARTDAQSASLPNAFAATIVFVAAGAGLTLLTLPVVRYVEQATRGTGEEIDGGVVELGRERLAVNDIPGLTVRAGDAGRGADQPR